LRPGSSHLTAAGQRGLCTPFPDPATSARALAPERDPCQGPSDFGHSVIRDRHLQPRQPAVHDRQRGGEAVSPMRHMVPTCHKMAARSALRLGVSRTVPSGLLRGQSARFSPRVVGRPGVSGICTLGGSDDAEGVWRGVAPVPPNGADVYSAPSLKTEVTRTWKRSPSSVRASQPPRSSSQPRCTEERRGHGPLLR
jgi:hypothetical protein